MYVIERLGNHDIINPQCHRHCQRFTPITLSNTILFVLYRSVSNIINYVFVPVYCATNTNCTRILCCSFTFCKI